MSALIYHPIYNLTIALSTNPFLSFPKYDEDIDDLVHLKLLLDTYKTIFKKDSQLLSFPVPIDDIIKLLFEVFQYKYNLDTYHAKQSFSQLMNLLVEHYPLFIHYDTHLSQVLTLYLTINPFYNFERVIVFHKKDFQYVPTPVKKERLLLNYWFWFPVLLTVSPINQYTSESNITLFCNELLNEWFDYEATQTGLTFNIETPTINTNQINTVLSDSLFTYFYKKSHQREISMM